MGLYVDGLLHEGSNTDGNGKKMLGVRWEEKWTNTSIRKEMKLPNIFMKIKDCKWSWVGLVASAGNDDTWYGCMKD